MVHNKRLRPEYPVPAPYVLTGTLYSSVMAVVGNKALCDGSWMDAEKRMYFPSGVKAEGSSDEEWVVSLCAVPPVAGITKISKLPLRSLAKAICLLSGDQMGVHSYEGCVVSWMAVPPPADTL